MTRPRPPSGLVFVPLLFAAISLPLALDLIGPNQFYGVRIAATHASEAEWYRINRIAGIAGIIAGLAGFAVNLAIIRSNLAAARKPVACLAGLIGVALVIMATALAAS